MSILAKRRILAAAVLACFALPTIADQPPQAPVVDHPSTEPSNASSSDARQALTPQILYQFLFAEIAAGRGQLSISAAAYLDLAKSTGNPQIAKRATEVAYFARQLDAALEAARIWSDAEPESAEAQQTKWGLLAATNRTEELSALLGQALQRQGAESGMALLSLGRLLLRFPDKPAALQVALKVTEPYQNLPEAHLLRAQLAYAARDSAQARASIDRALALRPNWEQATLVKFQLINDDPAQGLQLLADFVARNPGAREARLAYARALVDAKRYEDARKNFSSLLAEQPDNPELLYSVALLSMQLGDLAVGEGYLKRLLDLDFADKDGVRYYLGHGAEEAGRWQEAVKYFDMVAPGSAHFVSAQARAANLLRQQGQVDEARERLHRAAQSAPKEQVQLILAESQLLVDSRRYAEAFDVIDRALAAQPEEPTLLYESAMLADRIGKFEVLERNLTRLIKLKPDHAQAYNALGYSLAERNLRLDEAQKLIDKAIALAPDDPFILDSRGWVAFRRGDAAGAVSYLRKAFGARPDPEVAAHLGEVLWTVGRRDEAQTVWSEALKAHPENDLLQTTIRRFQP